MFLQSGLRITVPEVSLLCERIKKNIIDIKYMYIINLQIVLFADMTNGIFLYTYTCTYCFISINDRIKNVHRRTKV